MLTEKELEELHKDFMRNGPAACGSQVRRLVDEHRDMRSILRDALQDDTPGNRIWLEGVKAGLRAATNRVNRMAEELQRKESPLAELAVLWHASEAIRTIDLASILPS
jgi:predicted transcriptional regulator